MGSSVTVADRLYERMYTKLVTTPDGSGRDSVPPGQLPEAGEKVLAMMGEFAFRVSLATPLLTDQDVPDEVGFAVRRAASRLTRLRQDGTVTTGTWDFEDQPVVEWIMGPGIQDGALVIALDTDGTGARAALVTAMVAILVEELEGTGVPATISVPDLSTWTISPWTSSEERAAST